MALLVSFGRPWVPNVAILVYFGGSMWLKRPEKVIICYRCYRFHHCYCCSLLLREDWQSQPVGLVGLVGLLGLLGLVGHVGHVGHSVVLHENTVLPIVVLRRFSSNVG